MDYNIVYPLAVINRMEMNTLILRKCSMSKPFTIPIAIRTVIGQSKTTKHNEWPGFRSIDTVASFSINP